MFLFATSLVICLLQFREAWDRVAVCHESYSCGIVGGVIIHDTLQMQEHLHRFGDWIRLECLSIFYWTCSCLHESVAQGPTRRCPCLRFCRARLPGQETAAFSHCSRLAWPPCIHFFNHFNMFNKFHMFQCVQCVDCMTGALTWRWIRRCFSALRFCTGSGAFDCNSRKLKVLGASASKWCVLSRVLTPSCWFATKCCKCYSWNTPANPYPYWSCWWHYGLGSTKVLRDELHALFARLPPGCYLTVILDTWIQIAVESIGWSWQDGG